MSEKATTPFEDIKATQMTKDQLEELFVLPRNYDNLKKKTITCIYGERGCGKTMLLHHLENEINDDKSNSSIAIYFRFETASMYSLINCEMPEQAQNEMFSQVLHLTLVKRILNILETKIKYDGLYRDIANVLRPKIDNELYNHDITEKTELLGMIDAIIFGLKKAIRNNRCLFCIDTADLFKDITDFLSARDSSFCIQILFDEYENLTESQQRVVNSMLKDSYYRVSFKVCLRPDGFWTKTTLKDTEHLAATDDFIELNYTTDILGNDKDVTQMINEICKKRLIFFLRQNGIIPSEYALDINNYLQISSLKDEVYHLKNIDEYKIRLRSSILRELGLSKNDSTLNFVDDIIDLQVFSIIINKNKYDFRSIVDEFKNKSNTYKNWRDNYTMNALYLICDELKVFNKYCGLRIIRQITNNNIRMILSILDYCFSSVDNDIWAYAKQEQFEPFITLEAQTEAIKKYSDRRYNEIEYISKYGREEKNLVSALGNIFRLYITDKKASKFETNHFSIKADGYSNLSPEDEIKLRNMLKIAIMWGLLLDSPDNKKKGTSSSNYSYDDKLYRLHPIFCPRFKISHRKKQKADYYISEIYNMFTSPLSNDEVKSYVKIENENQLKLTDII